MRILLFLVLLISSWATSFAQEDIAVLEEEFPAQKFMFGYDIGIGMHGSISLAHTQGFYVDYKFAPKFLVGTGFQYSIFKGDFNITSEVSETNSLGQVSLITIQPRSVRYFELPINLSYRTNLTQLSLGISNCFRAGVRGRVRIADFDDPLSSFIGIGEEPLRKIEPYGFRRYHVRGHISATYFSEIGIGFKIKIFQPLSNLATSRLEIPSERSLFLHRDRPGGFTIHFIYQFPKLNY